MRNVPLMSLIVPFCTLFVPFCTLSTPAWAAPFCLDIRGIQLQCDYVDAAQCRTRAAQLNGLCTANPNELTLSPGTGKFCMVDSGRNSLCVYPDRDSCEKDARKNNAACIEKPDSGVQPDPYGNDPNRKY